MLGLEGHVGLHRLFNFSFFPLVIGVIVLDYCDIEWFALETEIILSFEIAPKYYILDSFIDYEGYAVSSKSFLLTVIYI